MAAFSYKAIDKNGKNKSGVIEADNAKQVRQLLREQGLMPLSMEQVAAAEKRQKTGFTLFSTSISAADLSLLTRQIATLVESSLPIEEALHAVAEQCDKPRHRNMMMAVRSKVTEGHTLADSMAEFPHVFDTLFRAMVAAGEKSGHLDVVLNRLADYTEKRQQTNSKITQALIYPVLMMVISIGIVVAMLTVVVPKIVGQFDTMGQSLPPLTAAMIAISEWLQAYGVFLLLAIVLMIVAFKRMLKNEALRKQYHGAVLRMPIIGKVARGLNTARFARTLSILTSSAVPLLESMRISADVLQNLQIKSAISEASINVREGSSLRAALDNTRMFPPIMMHMIASGEKSGELQQMLGRAADNQDREFETQVSVALKVFEPLLIVSMAGIVLLIVMAILQPIIELNNMVNI